MKDRVVEEFIIIIIFVLIILGCIADSLFPAQPIVDKEHECTAFVKYREHYQITPMTRYYRDSFKCIECGKDWKK